MEIVFPDSVFSGKGDHRPVFHLDLLDRSINQNVCLFFTQTDQPLIKFKSGSFFFLLALRVILPIVGIHLQPGRAFSKSSVLFRTPGIGRSAVVRLLSFTNFSAFFSSHPAFKAL